VRTAKLKVTATAIMLLALAAVILWQERRATRLLTELASLRANVAQTTPVEQSEALTKPPKITEQPMTQDQFRELLRLRGQVGTLKAELAQANSLALKAAHATRDQEATDEVAEKYKQEIVPRASFARDWMNAFKQYAVENQGRFPTNFDQAAQFLDDRAKAQTNVATDEFEIIYQGSRNDLTNRGDDEVIVLRERQLRRRYDGKWGRVYGLADGSSLQRFLDSPIALEQWEKNHQPSTALQ
jgi:hypothetical protein